jgi:HSP20 family protein
MFSRSTSVRDALLADFWRMQEELDDLLGGRAAFSGGIRSLPHGSFPAINVLQTPDNVQVYLFAPGLDPKKLDISIEQNLLSISGERQVPMEDKATYYRQERFAGAFNRAISLSDDVDPDRVDATYRDGIVHITLNRRESAKPRHIQIR